MMKSGYKPHTTLKLKLQIFPTTKLPRALFSMATPKLLQNVYLTIGKRLLNEMRLQDKNTYLQFEDIHNSYLTKSCVYLQIQDVSPRGFSRDH